MRGHKISPRQLRFVGAYIRLGIIKDAAIEAGYNAQGSHDRLMRNPLIKAALQRRRAWQLEGLDASADRVMAELAALATSDLRDCIDKATGQLKMIHNIPAKARRCISSLKITTFPDGRTTSEIKLWNKNAALDTLAKRWGLVQAAPEQAPGGLTINFVGVKPPAYALDEPRPAVALPAPALSLSALPDGTDSQLVEGELVPDDSQLVEGELVPAEDDSPSLELLELVASATASMLAR